MQKSAIIISLLIIVFFILLNILFINNLNQKQEIGGLKAELLFRNCNFE